jgi:hypothetical protein
VIIIKTEDDGEGHPDWNSTGCDDAVKKEANCTFSIKYWQPHKQPLNDTHFILK